MRAAPQAGRRATAQLRSLLPALACLGFAAIAVAKEQPVLEFGLGIGAIAFEDYRGSDTTHAYPLPIPYLIYYGKFLKADREGVRGTLFDKPWMELNLSGNATTPVRNDRVRHGMPDLKSTLELGPSLDLHLARTADSRVKLDLRLPVRAAVTAEAAARFIGWTVTPRLALDVADVAGFAGWNAGVLAGPLFADRRYHEYFYSVAPQYALQTRPAYTAGGGYAGTQVITALSKRFPRWWMGAFMRYDSLAGAVFDDSPLVKRSSYWSAGFGIAWMIHTSTQMVDVPD